MAKRKNNKNKMERLEEEDPQVRTQSNKTKPGVSVKKGMAGAVVMIAVFAVLVVGVAGIVLLVTLRSDSSPVNPNPPTPATPSNSTSVYNHTTTILSFGTRVPGDEGWRKTREYLKNTLSSIGWNVTEHESVYNSVPRMQGPVKFVNVIADYALRTTTPTASRKRFIIACHYDSKLFTQFTFLGATDSVVPCAMMLNMASNIANMNLSSANVPVDDVQLVFFDGEEAFENWSSSDSTYGSRALASKWEQEGKIGNIAYLMLLDLIGEIGATFYNLEVHYRSNAHTLFSKIAQVEQNLRTAGLLETSQRIFTDNYVRGNIEDDHVPFMNRGVPIMHLIAYPFPDVWHTRNDDAEHLDWETINDIQAILLEFLARYLRGTL